ncbi:hypothetical protein LCGC14_0248780 [marine sediment metagenome]|uniref:Uncharacterized protein n=1 Tax=marine sediment metagenome TaxID=412755 RepID=A0A0F9WQ67_9ZZZZ
MGRIANRQENAKKASMRERRRRVETAVCKGIPQWQIARMEGVDDSTICLDLKVIRKEWTKEDEEWGKSHRDRRIKEFEQLRRDAYKSFDRSKRKATVVPCQTCGGKGYIPDNGACPICEGKGYLRTEYKVAGDSKFLAEVRACTIEIAKLESLYPDKKVQVGVNGKVEHEHKHVVMNGNPYLNASDDDVLEIWKQMERLRNGNGRGTMNGDRVIEGKVIKKKEKKEKKGKKA